MENKKKWNLILSLIIILSTTICLCTVISVGIERVFDFHLEAGNYWIVEIEWRCAAPILVFSIISTLLSIFKIFKCSMLTIKSSDKTLGILSVLADVLVFVGFILVISVFLIWRGKFSGYETGRLQINRLAENIQTLLLVGIPTMFIASIVSFALNRKGA